MDDPARSFLSGRVGDPVVDPAARTQSASAPASPISTRGRQPAWIAPGRLFAPEQQSLTNLSVELPRFKTADIRSISAFRELIRLISRAGEEEERNRDARGAKAPPPPEQHDDRD